MVVNIVMLKNKATALFTIKGVMGEVIIKSVSVAGVRPLG